MRTAVGRRRIAVGRRRVAVGRRLVADGYVRNVFLWLLWIMLLVIGEVLAGGKRLRFVAARERLNEKIAHIFGALVQEAKVDAGEEKKLESGRVEPIARLGVGDFVGLASPFHVDRLNSDYREPRRNRRKLGELNRASQLPSIERRAHIILLIDNTRNIVVKLYQCQLLDGSSSAFAW